MRLSLKAGGGSGGEPVLNPGTAGVVFRGILDGGITPVAVKTLKGINRISRKLIKYNYNYRSI